MLDRIAAQFGKIFSQISGKGALSEKNIKDVVEEIQVALLEADVNLRVVRRFVGRTIEDALGEKVIRSVNPGQMFTKIVYDRMVTLLGGEMSPITLKGPDTLSTLLMVGLQGSGKTTTAVKVAVELSKGGRKPLLVAADLVRPAAVEQLVVLGREAGIEVFSGGKEGKPESVVKDALRYASRGDFNVAIVDTSGRIHIDDNMMDELVRIHKIAAPSDTLLVADSMTGQHAVEIAKEFDAAVSLGGIILTKFDSDTRGGAALSLKSVTGKPIKYVGTGEKISDLERFYPDRMASRILGMGDVVSLVEKAQETIEEKEALTLQKKLTSSTFTLQDYLAQIARVKKMGLKAMMGMLPGGGNIPDSAPNEKELKREEAIILSMTIAERENHRIIGPSRRSRIARGSGVSLSEVNRLIKKFEGMRVALRKMAKNKKYQDRMLSQFQ